MKHLRKFNESIVDLDAYEIIMKSNTYENMLNGKYDYDYEFIEDLEDELPELDFGDTDVYRAGETIFSENN